MATPEEQPQCHPQMQLHPAHVRIAHLVEDLVDEISWLHVAFKICAYTYIGFIVWITWQVLPLPGHWTIDQKSDNLPRTHQRFQNLDNYFESFDGFSTCSIRAADLYSEHSWGNYGVVTRNSFCPSRKALLVAMSNGGRVGFDTPYISKDCQYKWLAVTEVCMILERFDGLVFAGDDSLQSIYNGFNILLRQDLMNGALQTWSMSPNARAECQCENQFIKSDCAQYFVASSTQVGKELNGYNVKPFGNYACDRIAHTFLEVNAGSFKQNTITTLVQMLSKRSQSKYKPIPVIHSISPMTASQDDAEAAFSELLRLAGLSERKTPMLWIGPNAAGHIEIRGRKSNQEIWNFDASLARKAEESDVDVLKMWNMTIQASSWDGIRYGEKVALVQAMMVINWLSRLESS